MHFTATPQINRMAAPADNEAAKTELSVPGGRGGGEGGSQSSKELLGPAHSSQ